MALEIEYKKPHHWGWLIFLVILIAALAVTGWYGYRWYTTGEQPPIPVPIVSANASVDETEITPAQIQQYTVPAFNPRYIRIESLNIDKTRIYPVGLTANNLIDTPKNINDVAWYEKSATPGSGGVMILNGHNGGSSRDGIFAKLGTLKIGDRLTLERGDGQKFNYKVVENQSMTIEEVNATGMAKMGQSAEDGKEALNIITSDGKWVPRLGMYDRRIMLRAVIE